MVVSDDGMWWWDGSRWHPATAGTTGKPPRAPGSPWPWVIAALLGLALITALPIWIVFNRPGTSAGLVRGYGQGFAQTYLQQRRASMTDLEAKLAKLDACEHGRGPCYPAADVLGAAATAEQGQVKTESGLFFFPRCLQASAHAEADSLQQVRDSAVAIRLLSPSEAAAVRDQLAVLGSALQRAKAATAATPC